MRALVVGLGSMGKRRVRNLLALSITDVAGFDPREDRRYEAVAKYGIRVFESLNTAVHSFQPDVVVISTSPDQHMATAWRAMEHGISCFIEASVVDAERIRELHELTAATPILMAPSCTMRYFPNIRAVKDLVNRRMIGEVLNVSYRTGQYLPDWHPWERIEDYYVSQRTTGGCREIVPFELTWLSDVFGVPQALACVKAKLSDINAEIDDIYHCVLRFPNRALCNLTVEVISRPHATRELQVLGTEGQIVFSASDNSVRYAQLSQPDWVRIELEQGSKEPGYINPEEPYIAEIRDFIHAVVTGDKGRFPNTLLDDYRMLMTLHELEELSEATQ